MKKTLFHPLLSSAALSLMLIATPAFTARAATNVSYGPGYQSLTSAELTEEERAAIRDTAEKLRLSETQLSFKRGDVLRLYVEPVELAKAQGWEIDKVEFSDSSALRVLPPDDPAIQTKKQEIVDAMIASNIALTGDIDDNLLVVYLQAEKDGQSSITLSAKNPYLGAMVKMVCQAVSPDYVPSVSNSSSHSGSQTPATTDSDSSASNNRPGSTETPGNSGTTNPKPEDQEKPGSSTQPTNPGDNTGDNTNPGGSTENPGGTTDPGNKPENPGENPENPGGNTNPTNPDNPDQPEKPKDYDTSAWHFDQSTLIFTYDGQPHAPTLLGVEEGIELTLGEPSVNAGKYTYTVSAKAPDGYNPIPDFAIEYEIQPTVLTVSQTYNPETRKIDAVIDGLVDGDVCNAITTINGAEGNTLNAEPGSCVVSTTLDLDTEKAGNYIISDPVTSVHNTKTDNRWYDINMSYREEAGQLIIDFRLDNLKTEHAGTTKSCGIEFNLDYDHDRLQYAGDETGYWHMFYSESQDKEFGYYYGWTGPLPESATICSLKFDIIGDDTSDLIITAKNATFTNSDNGSMQLIYHTGDTSIVVNPEKVELVEGVITNWDPTKDTEYKFEHQLTDQNGNPNPSKVQEKENAYENLKDYISTTFPDLKQDDQTPELKPIDTTNWYFDESTLEFTYDGQKHQPTFIKDRDDVEVIFGEGYTDAGTYKCPVSFKVPEGYAPIPDMEVEFEIKPAKLTPKNPTYNPETNQMEVVIEGIVDGDIKSVSTVDSNGQSVTLDTAGSFTVTTDFTIKEDKAKNYTFDTNSVSSVVNLKSDHSWFDVNMSSNREGNKLTIDVSFSNIKSASLDNNESVILSFRPEYDSERLTLSSDVQTNGNYGVTDSGDVVCMFSDGLGSDRLATVQLTFEVTDEVANGTAHDLLVTVRNPELSYGTENGTMAQYKGTDVAIVINPEELTVVEGTVNGDPKQDVTVYGSTESAQEKLDTLIQEQFSADSAPDASLMTTDVQNAVESIEDDPGEDENSNPEASSQPASDSSISQPSVSETLDSTKDSASSLEATTTSTSETSAASSTENQEPATATEASTSESESSKSESSNQSTEDQSTGDTPEQSVTESSSADEGNTESSKDSSQSAVESTSTSETTTSETSSTSSVSDTTTSASESAPSGSDAVSSTDTSVATTGANLAAAEAD